MRVLIGVESGHKITLGYAQALREAGCYLELDGDGNVWVYCERTWHKRQPLKGLLKGHKFMCKTHDLAMPQNSKGGKLCTI